MKPCPHSSHVCILGCGRSGTSIFGELFDHISSYTYHSEPPYPALERYDYANPIAVKVPKPSKNQQCSPGLPFELDEFFSLFPEPRTIFWQVRHPLDAICSLRIGISRNWGHHPRPADWKDWLHKPLVQQCAHHWNHINSVGYEQVKDVVIVNKFEDMIEDPLANAYRICDMLGIDTTAHEEPIRSWARRVQNENNEDFIEAECSINYSRPDHVQKVGRWKENLSVEEMDSIMPIIKHGAANFGYSLPGFDH